MSKPITLAPLPPTLSALICREAAEARARHPGLTFLFLDGARVVVPLPDDRAKASAAGVPALFPRADLDQNIYRLLRAGNRVALVAPAGEGGGR